VIRQFHGRCVVTDRGALERERPPINEIPNGEKRGPMGLDEARWGSARGRAGGRAAGSAAVIENVECESQSVSRARAVIYLSIEKHIHLSDPAPPPLPPPARSSALAPSLAAQPQTRISRKPVVKMAREFYDSRV